MSTDYREPRSSGPRAGRPRRRRARERLADLDQLELTIDQIVAGGEGLGRFEGIPIFVPRSAPGDRLTVELVERRADFGRAEIVEILTPGAGRRQPPCPHFERCGGCDFQHLEEATQLKYKVAAVREALRRIGGIGAPPEVEVLAGPAWGYRRRTQLQIAESPERGFQTGYFGRRSHQLVAVDSCPVLAAPLEELLPKLPTLLQSGGPRRIDLLLGDEQQIAVAPPIAGLPGGRLRITVGEFQYQLDARCFFQGHLQLSAELVDRAIGPWSGEFAFDLYAGVGLFSLPLAHRYSRVTAVESDRIATRYARANAKQRPDAAIEVIGQSVDSWIEQLPQGASRVLVDPPRAGLSSRVVSLLTIRRPERLTYVSCNAATLARDLKRLVKTYELRSLVLLDLFPQTGHMEVVAQLVAKSSAGASLGLAHKTDAVAAEVEHG